AHRQPHVVALAPAGDGRVHVGDQTVVPEVAHVVGVRGPRPDSEELPARLGRVVSADDGFTRSVLRVDTPRGPAVELRAPALVRAVILPAEVAVHEVELAVEPLAVAVLIVRQPQRSLERRAEGGSDAESIARPAATVLRDDDDRDRKSVV